MQKTNLIELLDQVNPAYLDYQEWVNVGMALKHEGYSASDWDSWSRSDPRFHEGECFKKWMSFDGDSNPVTGGTIYQYAVDQGYEPQRTYDDGRGELDWNSTIKYDNDYKIIDKDWVEGKEIHEPTDWNPVQQIIKYLETLFESTENVGYVTQSYEKFDEETGQIEKYLPTKGSWSRSAGQLIQELHKCNGDIGAVLGDYNREAGAWIRFNPLDGIGVKNDNVTDYRYALVESDSMSIEKQNAIYQELELPIAALVHSGNKSLHAIVKVEAANYEEYRKRVDYLYNVCKKNGINVDTQNRNPSRLSRMPGVERNGQKQYLVDTNIGKSSWVDWFEWIEDLNDDLPDPESLEDTWDNLPDLAPELIKGVLRQGHKLLMAGPSKAGKSFALIELCIAIAEGQQWLGWDCAQGRVLYVNLELDRPSALHRFKDVYQALGYEGKNIGNIDIWNLRGNTVPMDKLAPKLIRRAAKKNYIAVVIDPIYKVLTGDENSADQMAHFTNQFDKVATELGSSVIYCHHHSKGSQGGKKSMDRASGSGVFAIDPDALLDLVELEIEDKTLNSLIDKEVAELWRGAIEQFAPDYYSNKCKLSDFESALLMEKHAAKALDSHQFYEINNNQVKPLIRKFNQRTAWRVEGTLREFAKFKPRNIWFNYPYHTVDKDGLLKDMDPEGETPQWKKNFVSNKKSPEERKEERINAVEVTFNSLTFDGRGEITVQDMADAMGVTEKTVRNRIKEHGNLVIDDGIVFEKVTGK